MGQCGTEPTQYEWSLFSGLLSGFNLTIANWNGNYVSGTTDESIISNMLTGNTYWTKMDQGGGSKVGGLDGYVAGNSSNNYGVEIASPGVSGSVSQNLYFFTGSTTAAVELGTLQTIVDASGNGYTKYSAVPVPSSLLLLAPGLLGLFGIRRRVG